MTRKKQPTVAFVLSGGASLGAVQVGMLRALYERHIKPDVIVGTSAGALNGAYIASRPQTPPTADSLARIWRELHRGQVFPVNPLTGLLGFLGIRDHLVPESGLERLIERHVQCPELEEFPIPLHVVAVDVVTGQELRLSQGPVLEAVLASAAIPGVLQPVSWEGRTLMDGGVANNTPISHAVALGADEIYVLPAGRACALEAPPRGALGMTLHAMTLLVQRRLEADIEALADTVRLHVLPPPCPLAIQPIDFGHADELIDRSLADARHFLDATPTARRSPRGRRASGRGRRRAPSARAHGRRSGGRRTPAGGTLPQAA
jgi:NTE family protein